MLPSIDIVRSARRELLYRSFGYFVRYFWNVVEPTRSYLPSIAIDAMVAAAQVWADGRIKRLAVATCPGTAKSVIWGVMLPAWLEMRTQGRARIMVGSYAWAFATRDSQRCRDLVQSDEYQEIVDGEWEIREDANRKDDWWTSATGRRLITSVDGKSTGERCTWQIMDDALSAASVFSAADKAEATRWVNEVLTSRLEDQRIDPRALVGQRLCVDDPTSDVLKRGWKYLCLPAVLGPCPELGVESETEPCELYDDEGVLVWRDPRAPGEPIVELLDLPALVRLRTDLGSTAFSAQYLQRPADDSTAIIQRKWWRFYTTAGRILPCGAWVSDGGEGARSDLPRPAGCDSAPAVSKPERFDRITMAVDLTFGSIKGDFADVRVWGARGVGRYLLAYWHKRAGFEESMAAIEALYHEFPGCKVLIEKAANGAASIEMLRKTLPSVIAQKPIGKKEQRLGAVAPTVETGNCYLPLGAPGLGEFVEELAGGTKHDDMADTTAYAILDLNTRRGASAELDGGLIGYG